MYIIYHSSEKFGPVTATSIVSLLENNKKSGTIHILYIKKDMTDETERKIKLMVEKYGRTIEFINMPDWSKRLGISLKSCKSGWLGFGYNRLFITDLVPENIDRVLYMDSDTIVEQDISYLWDIDFEDNYLAGVDDCLSKNYNEIVEISDTATYCNAGVLLLNIKKWRQDNLKEKFIEYVVARNGYFVFNEQSVINSVCSDKIKILPCKYNTTTLVYSFEYDELMRMRNPGKYAYSREEYYSARENPAITHFTGCFFVYRRPWIQNSDHPHADMFNKYYEMTPWKDVQLECQSRVSLGKRMSHIFPKSIMVLLVNLLYTNFRVKMFKNKLKREREL